MKTYLYSILFFLVSYTSNGQRFSTEIDSLTQRYVLNLPSSQSTYFNQIITTRAASGFLNGLDTANFEAVLIKETFTYSDSSGRIEHWFMTSNDSVKTSWFNYHGKYIGPDTTKSKAYSFSMHVSESDINFKRWQRMKLKPVQKLDYSRKQIWSHGCVIPFNGKAKYKSKRRNQLKSTYQIITYIDKKSDRIIVSLQVPPKHPHFWVQGHNFVWDF